ncbi:MAG TPA: ferric reductase-like transmembrane domain-containing protein [Pseudonocardiaceae bacterium]|jgi:sulfoxide reductase heme-binding subunit YedZ|nr:ferric reductase-like transmembrane domain-containing protein [Pseudonocardiaceae bacterium]
MTDALWYLGRGSGVIALTMLTLVVALGIATRSGRVVAGQPRFVLTAVHRSASLLSVVFLVIHVGTLLFDPYAELSLVNLVVPFTSTYRPLWVGLGAAALDLLAALVITSLLRDRIGPRIWRAVHWAAYVCWPVALAHGLGSGSDGGQLWFRVFAGVCSAVVAGCLIWRLSGRFTENRRVPTASPVRTVRRNSTLEAGR